MKQLYALLFLFSSVSLQAQESVGIDNCRGAVNLFESGQFTLQFLGNKSSTKPLGEYPALAESDNANLIWFNFVAPREGVVTFNAKSSVELKYIILEEGMGDVCRDIDQGNADISRLMNKTGFKEVGLSKQVSDNFLYPVSIEEGKKIMLAIIAPAGSKDMLELNFEFISKVPEDASKKRKVIDKRDDEFSPFLHLSIVDIDSDEPLVADINLSGVKGLENLYKASEVFLSVAHGGDLEIKCEIPEYFYNDTVVRISYMKNTELVIKMTKVHTGKSLSIEEIEFLPGTSEISEASMPKLIRLRDFLLLHAELNFEIQGHVFATGDNTFAAQKMSEARAKKVMKYLEESGIDKKRMEAVGYGNTRPVFPKAKFAYEEQANRRVEIMIK